jgi:hypothetical protein
MTLPVHFVVALRYVLDFTAPLYLLSRNIASLRTSCYLLRYMSTLLAMLKRVGDGVSDVTSVNTVQQQWSGKVVRLNIQPEITCSISVVEFNTPWRWCSDGAM